MKLTFLSELKPKFKNDPPFLTFLIRLFFVSGANFCTTSLILFFQMFQRNELILAALNVTLIIIRNGLLNSLPMRPVDYPHVWDFYRRNDLLASYIRNIIDFLDTSNCAMDEDVHVTVERFSNDLRTIQNFIQDCNELLDANGNNSHLNNYVTELRIMIEGLYTTLCSIHTCTTCIKK